MSKQITQVDLIVEELRGYETMGSDGESIVDYANLEYIRNYILELKEEHDQVKINELIDQFLKLYSEAYNHDSKIENKQQYGSRVKMINDFINKMLKELESK